jgi:hypothetical protein
LREWNSGHPALGPSLYRVSYLSFEEFSFWTLSTGKYSKIFYVFHCTRAFLIDVCDFPVGEFKDSNLNCIWIIYAMRYNKRKDGCIDGRLCTRESGMGGEASK